MKVDPCGTPLPCFSQPAVPDSRTGKPLRRNLTPSYVTYPGRALPRARSVRQRRRAAGAAGGKGYSLRASRAGSGGTGVAGGRWARFARSGKALSHGASACPVSAAAAPYWPAAAAAALVRPLPSAPTGGAQMMIMG